MTITELGPLPEPLNSASETLTEDDVPQFSARDMRAYAMQERAAERELAAQHIAALEQEIARQKEVIASVNARCDHLGMSLRDIKAERDAEREMCRELVREALDADEGDHVLGTFLADRMRAALWP